MPIPASELLALYRELASAHGAGDEEARPANGFGAVRLPGGGSDGAKGRHMAMEVARGRGWESMP